MNFPSQTPVDEGDDAENPDMQEKPLQEITIGAPEIKRVVVYRGSDNGLFIIGLSITILGVLLGLVKLYTMTRGSKGTSKFSSSRKINLKNKMFCYIKWVLVITFRL